MAKCYVLPGMGADGRLFDAQRAVRDIQVIDWIPPAHPHEPLADYARRLASSLHLDEPYDLGGASFGGMTALELARHLTPRRVFLFGSCRSPQALPPWLRLLARFAHHPPAVLHPLVARFLGATTPAHIRLFADMLAKTPPHFFRWAARAVFSWTGVEELPMPVLHIHGDRDRVMPIHRVRPDRVIAGAGHLLNMTHGEAVNEFIA